MRKDIQTKIKITQAEYLGYEDQFQLINDDYNCECIFQVSNIQNNIIFLNTVFKCNKHDPLITMVAIMPDKDVIIL